MTSTIITCLEDIFSRHGLPETLTSDNGAEEKARHKAYADARRGAKYSNTNIGDEVLVKQEKQNKLTTTFSPVPYKVVDKKGNSQQIESSDGVQYSRNTSHVKTYITESVTTEEVIPEKPESSSLQDRGPREVSSDTRYTDQTPVEKACGSRPHHLRDYIVTKP